jgi:sugar (pentulose or hexulose) kinase
VRDAWIGLDVGTTSLKAVAYDRAGLALGHSRRPTVWRATAHGAELDPGVLLDAALDTLAAVAQCLPDDLHVAGIGITSMGEVGVLVDGAGRVVAPAIAWHDSRDDQEVAELDAAIGAREFGARTGKPLRGQFSITKHRWLLRHHAPAATAVRWFTVADWVARGLGAGQGFDRTLACRTGWYDIAADDWWDEALAWSGAHRELMPEVVDSGTPIGRVRTGHARLLGAVVTTAGHDHQAAALGVGATALGDELDSSGTAEALVRTVLSGLAPEQLVILAERGVTTDISIQPGRWSLLGGTEGGLTMQEALDELGVGREDLPALDQLALAGDGESGRRWRAAVDSATAHAAALHQAISAVAGPHHRLIVTGGWSHSEMVLDSKRRAFGVLEVSNLPEAGSFGAAIVAARATGDLAPGHILEIAQ